HKIDGYSAEGWELVPKKANVMSTAAFIGQIKNSFLSIDEFIGKEVEGVYLTPNFFDVLNNRSVSAVRQHRDIVDTKSKVLHGFYVSPTSVLKERTKLPSNTFFSKRECTAAENNLQGADGHLPAYLTLELNASQVAYIELALRSKVSIVQGPPGTGKSYLGGHLICELNRRGEVVVASAMSNVAIQSLLDKYRKAYRFIYDTEPTSTALLFSKS
ncbi:MAG: hypothetical protein Q9218_007430, partial [Villophora microphyllina]